MTAYHDADANLEVLRHKTLGIIGYGNRGWAQALNLPDSGLKIIVGSVRDQGARQAAAEGFKVSPIAQVAEAEAHPLKIAEDVMRRLLKHTDQDSGARGQKP